MFKVNNKDTRTTPLASFWYLLLLTLNIYTSCSSVSFVNFKQINADWDYVSSSSRLKIRFPEVSLAE